MGQQDRRSVTLLLFSVVLTYTYNKQSGKEHNIGAFKVLENNNSEAVYLSSNISTLCNFVVVAVMLQVIIHLEMNARFSFCLTKAYDNERKY